MLSLVLTISFALTCFCATLPSQIDAVAKRLMEANFPDPSIIEVDGSFYAFSTQNGGARIPVAIGTDLSRMTLLTDADGKMQDAMPTLPSWTSTTDPDVWAPDVIQLADASFVLYFSASWKNDTSKHCVGAATSQAIAGPYVPVNDTLACPTADGGAIDPAGFIDSDGRVYVVYKVDGNSLGGPGPCLNGDQSHDTPIMLQEVSATDGYTPVGEAHVLLHLGPSDGPLIEAPSLVRSIGGTYVLFFSSNCYKTTLYDTSYATSTSVKGPYSKSPTPLLATKVEGLNSPGGTDVLADGSRIVFHADLKSGDPSIRQIYTSKIQINGTMVLLL